MLTSPLAETLMDGPPTNRTTGKVTTQAGKLVLALRYGAKPLEISKGKNAIEVIKQATQAGERPALNSTSFLSLHQSGKSESIRAI